MTLFKKYREKKEQKRIEKTKKLVEQLNKDNEEFLNSVLFIKPWNKFISILRFYYDEEKKEACAAVIFPDTLPEHYHPVLIDRLHWIDIKSGMNLKKWRNDYLQLKVDLRRFGAEITPIAEVPSIRIDKVEEESTQKQEDEQPR